MVAWIQLAAHLSVDTGLRKPRAQRRTEKQMVNAKASVTLVAVPPIRPERIHRLIRMLLAQRIDPTVLEKLTER